MCRERFEQRGEEAILERAAVEREGSQRLVGAEFGRHDAVAQMVCSNGVREEGQIFLGQPVRNLALIAQIAVAATPSSTSASASSSDAKRVVVELQAVEHGVRRHAV